MRSLILELFGTFFIVVVLFILGVIWWLYSKFKMIFRNIEAFTEMGRPPGVIHLVPVTLPEFHDRATMDEDAISLQRRGFQKIGAFAIPEIHGLLLQAFIDSRKNQYAVIYEHPLAGVFCDIVLKYQDGDSLTASNAPTGQELDQRPGHVKLYQKGARVEQLVDILNQHMQKKPVCQVRQDTFVADFENAYAEEMEWRATRGGTTQEEIRRVAANMDEDIPEEAIVRTQDYLEDDDASAELEEKCLETFLQQTHMSALEWEKIRDRVIIIHEKMELRDAISYLEDDDFTLEDRELQRLPKDILSAFAQANRLLPSSQRFTLLGTVKTPVVGAVYLIPEEDEA